MSESLFSHVNELEQRVQATREAAPQEIVDALASLRSAIESVRTSILEYAQLSGTLGGDAETPPVESWVALTELLNRSLDSHAAARAHQHRRTQALDVLRAVEMLRARDTDAAAALETCIASAAALARQLESGDRQERETVVDDIVDGRHPLVILLDLVRHGPAQRLADRLSQKHVLQDAFGEMVAEAAFAGLLIQGAPPESGAEDAPTDESEPASASDDGDKATEPAITTQVALEEARQSDDALPEEDASNGLDEPSLAELAAIAAAAPADQHASAIANVIVAALASEHEGAIQSAVASLALHLDRVHPDCQQPLPASLTLVAVQSPLVLESPAAAVAVATAVNAVDIDKLLQGEPASRTGRALMVAAAALPSAVLWPCAYTARPLESVVPNLPEGVFAQACRSIAHAAADREPPDEDERDADGDGEALRTAVVHKLKLVSFRVGIQPCKDKIAQTSFATEAISKVLRTWLAPNQPLGTICRLLGEPRDDGVAEVRRRVNGLRDPKLLRAEISKTLTRLRVPSSNTHVDTAVSELQTAIEPLLQLAERWLELAEEPAGHHPHAWAVALGAVNITFLSGEVNKELAELMSTNDPLTRAAAARARWTFGRLAEMFSDEWEPPAESERVSPLVLPLHPPGEPQVLSLVEQIASGETPRLVYDFQPLPATSEPGTASVADEPVATTEPPDTDPPPEPLQTSDETDVLEVLVQDPAHAYWVARGLEETGRQPSIPSWVVATHCAATWLSGGAAGVEPGLRDLVEDQRLPQQGAARVAAVTAALQVAPAYPFLGLTDFLEPLGAPLEPINPVVHALREFIEATGSRLAPGALQPTVDQSSHSDGRIRDLAARVARWLDEAPQKRIPYQPATEVLHRLAATDGPFSNALRDAAADRRGQAAEVSRAIHPWRSRRGLDQLIDDVDRDSRTWAGRRIDGRARQRLLDMLEEVVEQANEWATLANTAQANAPGGEWLQRRLDVLSRALSELIPHVRDALESTSKSESSCDALTARLALAALDGVVATYFEGRIASVFHESLAAGLADALLEHPEISMDRDEDGLPFPTADSWMQAVHDLRSVPHERDVESALRRWLERNDYRWVDRLLHRIEQPEHRATISSSVDAARKRAGDALMRGVRSADEQVEQAYLDGDLDPNERAAFAAELEQVRQLAALRDANLDVAASSIKRVVDSLDHRRAAAAASRRERIAALRPSLNAQRSDGAKRLLDLLQDASENRHLFDELVVRIEGALDDGSSLQDIADSLLDTRSKGNGHRPRELEEFQRIRGDIDRLLQQRSLSDIEHDIRSNRPPAELHFGSSPEPHRKQLIDALESWRRLKREDAAANPIYRILEYVGFTLAPNVNQALTMTREGRGWSHWQVQMSAVPSPVAALGSEVATHVDLLCVSDLGGLFAVDESELKGTGPVVILYLGRMQLRHWEDWVAQAFSRDLRVLIIDEVLLLYLARFTDSRLGAFFRCALPASALNPYVPFAAGNVPLEMFVGRNQLVAQLEDRLGPALVYGGRQLGKSSLLQHIARTFTNARREQYAFFLEIRNIGVPGGSDPVEAIWGRMSRALRDHGLLSDRSITEPKQVADALRKIMRQPERRLLFLLDEADAFLSADSVDGFRTVADLKTLMDETSRRFKVVFAGLQNVTRYASIPNQPLAHLGTPVAVGPLDPADARRLVLKLEDFGLRLDDPAILHILSLTNHHPALLQLLCRRLLEEVRKRPASAPPIRVTTEHIETVFRSPEVRQEFRERFLWTLNLDHHYGVLTRAMVLDQMESRDGFARTYTSHELRNLGADWWPSGFASLTPDEFRAYVEELAKLGVLAPAGEGAYRLASPNMVRLLGTTDDIEAYLLRMLDHDNSVGSSAMALPDILHARCVGSHTFSPLTQGQLRRLGLGSTGVSMIIGSSATGLDRVLDALRTFVAEDAVLPSEMLHLPVADLEQDSAWRHVLDRAEERQLIVAIQASDPDSRDVATTLAAVLERIRPLQTDTRRTVRALLLIGPAAHGAWLKVDPERRAELELEMGAVVLEPWAPEAVARRLEDENVFHEPGWIERLMEVTGGLHWLLDVVLERMRSARGGGLRNALEHTANELSNADSHLARSALARFGLRSDSEAVTLLRGLVEYAGVSQSVQRTELQEIADELMNNQPVRELLLHLERMGLLQSDGDTVRIATIATTLVQR